MNYSIDGIYGNSNAFSRAVIACCISAISAWHNVADFYFNIEIAF